MKYAASFVFLGLLAASSPGQEARLELIKPASVKFETLKTKHLAVDIKVNGKGPYRVIFDTGAPVTVLNNRIANEAGLVGKEAGKGPAFFGMRGQANIKTLEVGELKAENVPVVIMDHPLLKAAAQVLGPLDGIVGFPFFARYKMTLDYQAGMMTFVPVDYRPVDLMDSMMFMMMDPKQKPAKKVLTSSTVWGFGVEKAKDDEQPGVDVKKVLEGSAAEAAGLKAGDRLLVLDGVWTESLIDCQRAAAGVRPGQKVKARLKRGDKELEIAITPPAGL